MTPDDLLHQADTEIERAERLLDIAVVARAMSVSAQTVRNWIRAGKLGVVLSPSGRRRIPASELAAFRKVQKTQSNHV